MDTYLAIASKRDRQRHGDRPIPTDVEQRILDAGRLSGSARNKQPWRYLVVQDSDRRRLLADAVYEPGNVHRAQLVVAIFGTRPLDLGRSAQNMMLAAWNDGVASSPNGIADADLAMEALGTEEAPVIVLTFGYPDSHPGVDSRTAEEWSARADRRPLSETVERL